MTDQSQHDNRRAGSDPPGIDDVLSRVYVVETPTGLEVVPTEAIAPGFRAGLQFPTGTPSPSGLPEGARPATMEDFLRLAQSGPVKLDLSFPLCPDGDPDANLP